MTTETRQTSIRIPAETYGWVEQAAERWNDRAFSRAVTTAVDILRRLREEELRLFPLRVAEADLLQNLSYDFDNDPTYVPDGGSWLAEEVAAEIAPEDTGRYDLPGPGTAEHYAEQAHLPGGAPAVEEFLADLWGLTPARDWALRDALRQLESGQVGNGPDGLVEAGLFIAEPMVASFAHCTDLPRRPQGWVRGRGFTLADLAKVVAEVDKGSGVSWALPRVAAADSSQSEPPTVTLEASPARCFPPVAPGDPQAQARRLAVAATRLRWVRTDGRWELRSPGMTAAELDAEMQAG